MWVSIKMVSKFNHLVSSNGQDRIIDSSARMLTNMICNQVLINQLPWCPNCGQSVWSSRVFKRFMTIIEIISSRQEIWRRSITSRKPNQSRFEANKLLDNTQVKMQQMFDCWLLRTVWMVRRFVTSLQFSGTVNLNENDEENELMLSSVDGLFCWSSSKGCKSCRIQV